MRIAVTGGAGFIGSHLCDALTAAANEILVIDDLSSGSRDNLPPEVRFDQIDVRSDEVAAALTDFKPDAVFHLAAQASVTVSTRQPDLDASINVLGTINVAQAAVAAGCERFVYTNTGGALYGDDGELPFAEDSPIAPVSPYGLSKWTAERYLHLIAPERMTLVCLRLANVYGPRQVPHGEAGVVAIFTDRMLNGLPVTIFGDGEQTRDFVYVQDVVRAHLAALDAKQSLSANVASGVGTSVNEIHRLIALATGSTLPAELAPARPGEVRHSVLSAGRADELLGWTAQTAIDEGIALTVATVKDHGTRV